MAAVAKKRDDVFRPREVSIRGVRSVYRVYVPPEAHDAPLPVIVFLHGAGESGSDGLAQTTVGLGPAILANPDHFPAIVLFPQARPGGWRLFNFSAAVLALNDIESSFDVDRERVYATGISMGGYGTWLLALEQPERFAAVVPICGGLDRAFAIRAGILHGTGQAVWDEAAARLAHIAHWVFHGDADEIIPVEESRMMVGALRRAGADVRYTEYEGVAHNSWDRAYADPELIPWLLQQRRVIK